MTVSLIRATESHTGTTGSASQASFTWQAGNTGDTPTGIVVFVLQGGSATDYVTSVTYGGTTLSAISGATATDSSTEQGRCAAYYLGASVPQGQQSVVVNRTNNATVMYAVAFLLDGAADLRPFGTPFTQSDNGTIAAGTVDDGLTSGATIALAAAYSGDNTPAPGAATSMTSAHTLLGSYAYSFGAAYETTPTYGSRSRGCSQTTSDDRAHVVLLAGEVLTLEAGFTSEAKSSVDVTGSVTEGSQTYEAGFTTESETNVELTGTVTHAVWECGFTSETLTRVQIGTATTIHLNSTANCGAIVYNGGTLAQARAGTSTLNGPFDDNSAGLGISTPAVFMGWMEFDTSSVPDDAWVSEVVPKLTAIRVTLSGVSEYPKFILLGGYDHGAAVGAEDWQDTAELNALVPMAEYQSSGSTTVYTQYAWTSTSAMNAYINKSGHTHFVMTTDHVMDAGYTNTVSEECAWATYNQSSSYWPDFEVTYVQGIGKADAVWEAGFTSEAKSAVDVTGSVAEGGVTLEAGFTSESVSKVEVGAPGAVTLTVTSGYDGRVQCQDSSWTDIATDTNITNKQVGTDNTAWSGHIGPYGSNWVVNMAFFSWDTSGLPSGAAPNDDSYFELYYTDQAYNNDYEHVQQIRLHDWSPPDLATSDWLTATNYQSKPLLASRNSTTITSGSTWYSFTSAAALPAAINLTGRTNVVVCTDDYTGTAPTQDQDRMISWHEVTHGGETQLAARLHVAYDTVVVTHATWEAGFTSESKTRVKIGTVVQSGLVAEYVAALAKLGTAPGNNTDPTSVWDDLAGSRDGALSGFAYTGSSGWAGSGTSGDPYTLYLSGDNDRVDCGGDTFATDLSFTIETWSRSEAIGSERAIYSSVTDNEGDGIVVTRDATGHYIAWVENENGIVSAGTYDTTDFHHVVATLDGTTLRLYIDADVEATTRSISHITGVLYNTIGAIRNNGQAGNYWRYWTGAIPTVRLYDRALTADEISQNYDAGVVAYAPVKHAVWEAGFTSEALSKVEVTGQETAGGTTYEAGFTSESLSSVVVSGSKTEWTAEAGFTSEAKSAVAVAGSVTHWTAEAGFTSEAKSAVVVTATKTEWTAEAGFTSEAKSAVVVTAGPIVYSTGFTNEAKSSVVVSGAVAQWVAEAGFTSEAKSAVVISGQKVEWTAEAGFTSEAKSAVVVSGQKTDWVAEAGFTSEAVTAVVVNGSKLGMQECGFTSEAKTAVVVTAGPTTSSRGFTSESVTSVVVTGQKTEWIAEAGFTSEAKSSVVISGAKVEAVWEAGFTNEAKSSVVVAGQKTDWIAEAGFTSEAVSKVEVAGYKEGAVYTWDAGFTSEAKSAVVVATGGIAYGTGFTSEGKSAVVISATKTDWIAEATFTSEAVSAVVITATATHAVWEAGFSSEGKTNITLAGQKNATFEWDAGFASEAKSRVNITGTRIVAPDVIFIVGAPQSGWRVEQPESGWPAGAPEGAWRTSTIKQGNWTVSAPESGWPVKKPR